jgi:hypothetical protein
MGYKHVDAALQARLPYTTGIEMGTLKLVLVAICQHADNNSNYCFPSTRRLARMTHLGKSTVAKAIAYLDSIGCFTNYSKGTGHGSSSYIVDLDRLRHWAIDWDSVHHMDTDENEEDFSVHHVDVASTTETQSPLGSTQSPPLDPNQSFDRSGVQSGNTVKDRPSGGSSLASRDQKTESVKTDRGVVAKQNQPQPPEKRSLVGSVAPL